MRLLDFINEKSNNAYEFYKLVSVIFDENTQECTFKFVYKNDCTHNDKIILEKLIKEYLKEDIRVIVKCKKAYVDDDLVKIVLFNFITRNFTSVGVGFSKDNIDVNIVDEQINVYINCNEFQYGYLNSPDIKSEILSYAESFFFEEFILKFKSDSNIANEIEEIPLIPNVYINEENEIKIMYNEVENIENVIGEVKGNPIKIACIKKPLESVEIAGTVFFLTEKSFETKRKDENGDSIRKTYYSFTLLDDGSRMNCVYFPTKADFEKFAEIQEHMNIIVSGDVEEFNGRINFKVKSIAKGNILESKPEPEDDAEIIKEPFEKYICVNPEPYVEIFQDNLFFTGDTIGQYLLDNDVVVFDIETTGLEATRCEIIEIGAVKLHKGKIIETFETLIKPTTSIPDEIINLTGITDDMVASAPNIKQVMPDFYKFCYGCTIIAYNIDFDYKFISVHGKKLGYVFDNRQIDAMFLARAYIPGLKNFKLSTVCKKLGVSLENAHRAVHDATATAEVVIKLSPNIT